MTNWSNRTPQEQRPDQSNQEELRQKQVAFLQAVHAFAEDPSIKQLTDERRETAVAALIALVDKVEPYKYDRGGKQHTGYNVEPNREVKQYFRFREDLSSFFREIGEANGHKPVSEWDKKEIELKARKRFDSGVIHIRDTFEKLATKESLADKLKYQISNTLQDIAMRDPGAHEVTTQTVTGLLSGVNIPEHTAQDRYWTNLKQDLQEASGALPADSKLRTLVDTIAQAGERSGLFNAVDNLLGGDKSRA